METDGQRGLVRAPTRVLESEISGHRILRLRVTIAGFTLRMLGDEPDIQIVSAVVEGLVADGTIALGDVQLTRGFGGAPVFNANGVVVGMVTTSRNIESRSGGLALPADRVTMPLGKQSVM